MLWNRKWFPGVWTKVQNNFLGLKWYSVFDFEYGIPSKVCDTFYLSDKTGRIKGPIDAVFFFL